LDLKLLVLSLLRVVGLAAIFIGSWLLAYMLGHVLAAMGLLRCRDAAECELFAGLIVMPLGGTALYVLTLVIWSLLARRQTAPEA
jgi:hypothetical protein